MPKKEKVFVTRRLPARALEVLRPHFDLESWDVEDTAVPREVLLEAVRDVSGLLCLLTDRIDLELMDRAPRLKIVANMAVGYDNIDVEECSRRGITVTNTPDVLTEATADLAFALLMATARRIPEAQDLLRANRWDTWSPMLLTGQDVYGATLGIVGMGRIGSAVARRARGFDMKILYHGRQRVPAVEEATGAAYVPMDELLKNADHVTLHVPLTAGTRHLIGKEELTLMKPTAILINTSRGAVVDETALFRALKDRRIRAAGLDVFETEPLPFDSTLRSLPNVVLLPHIGSATVGARTEMAVLAATNIRDFLQDGKPHTPVRALGSGVSR